MGRLDGSTRMLLLDLRRDGRLREPHTSNARRPHEDNSLTPRRALRLTTRPRSSWLSSATRPSPGVNYFAITSGWVGNLVGLAGFVHLFSSLFFCLRALQPKRQNPRTKLSMPFLEPPPVLLLLLRMGVGIPRL